MPTLDWIGKSAVVNHHNEVPFHLLETMPDLSFGERPSGNLLIEGDNLVALKALLPYYAGQVKCIYIDPPYNTGEERWIFNDNVNSSEIRAWLGKVVGPEGETLDRHDRWLCMMYPRLALLREMLRDDGVIFVSIDDNEIVNLHNILRALFGANNFLANIVWQKRTSPDARLHLGPAHDFVVAYAKNLAKLKPTLKRVPPSGERRKAYKNPDGDPRGDWASVDITGQTGHATPDQFYEITTPAGVKMKPPKGRCWAMAERTFLQLVSDNRIWFGKQGKSRPRLKKFLRENEGVTTWTWWAHSEVGHNQEATKELNEVMGSADVFDNPKPSRLIRRILQVATEKDSIVLDSFAGSGTTATAVMQANQEDGGTRRFILVEMDGKIAQTVTAERTRRVSQGYKKTNGTSVEGLNSGFRYCRLGPKVFTEQGHITPDVKFADLARHVFFTETGEPLPSSSGRPSPLIGIHNGTAIYLLYNGILKDKAVDGGNVLTWPVVEKLQPHDGPKIIYGTACRISPVRRQRANIVFKQIPYAIRVS